VLLAAKKSRTPQRHPSMVESVNTIIQLINGSLKLKKEFEFKRLRALIRVSRDLKSAVNPT